MGKFTDLSGQCFGSWQILRLAGTTRGGSFYECQCECGTIKNIFRGNLVSGKTKSCGCMKAESIAKAKTSHGQSRKKRGKATKLYNTWSSMLTRCCNPNSNAYSRYGGRGIKVCDRWHKFENFAKDMGEPETWQSIERIDNNGNYEPENCRWADSGEQMRNTSKTKLTQDIVLKIKTNEISLKEVQAITGCSASTYYAAKSGVNWK